MDEYYRYVDMIDQKRQNREEIENREIGKGF